jgi:uncharacterized protein (DUF433 family)
MDKAYVENRESGWWLAGTRISLDSVVYAFRRGASPETIRSSFPSLTLEQVYGAITFYLSRQQDIDEYLLKAEVEYETARQLNHERLLREKPDLMGRLTEAKDELGLLR